AIERLGLVAVALLMERRRQIVQVPDVLRMVLAARAQVDTQRFAVQTLRSVEVAAFLRDSRKVVERHRDVLVVATEPRRANAQTFVELPLGMRELTLGVLDHTEPAQTPRCLEAVGALEQAVDREAVDGELLGGLQV